MLTSEHTTSQQIIQDLGNIGEGNNSVLDLNVNLNTIPEQTWVDNQAPETQTPPFYFRKKSKDPYFKNFRFKTEKTKVDIIL